MLDGDLLTAGAFDLGWVDELRRIGRNEFELPRAFTFPFFMTSNANSGPPMELGAFR
jgi:hypothetical protein